MKATNGSKEGRMDGYMRKNPESLAGGALRTYDQGHYGRKTSVVNPSALFLVGLIDSGLAS